ncbi:class I SAM-dependent methyltransferase [Streptacidiphilus monticola]|uniref:Class I SAM-dependent methyltransferase n=1 Tax=Streptacidiphilus monticola TaxID=2161674 RepID=A0ABW1G4D2_9ACTN
MREGHRGSGPGAIAPDGCAVELYARLPAGEEPDLVAGAVPAGASVLELGCGAGRVTHPLLQRGFVVTAVDDSAEMLARVRGARTVCSPIESLELGEVFDVVLLASHLVNTADPELCAALLRSCARHVSAAGCVLVQREPEGLYDRAPFEREFAGGRIRVEDGRVEYVFPDGRWVQEFRRRYLDEAAFERALEEAGLRWEAWLTADRGWARARLR